MPVCSWCGKLEKNTTTVESGRGVLNLCPFCLAQHELKEGKELRVEDFSRPPSLWERIKRLFRR
ncbi:MAG: hypothetical protein AB1758_02935 [Candidatus Eremiobacterota bacterium]